MQAEGDVIRSPAAEKPPPGFAAFFAGEHARLFKALYLVTGNRADAAELMQDAFLKNCGSGGTGSTGSPMTTSTCSAWR